MADVASVVAMDELDEGDEIDVELVLRVVEGVVVVVVDADAAVLVDTVVLLVKIDTANVDVEPGKVPSNADSTKQRTMNFKTQYIYRY